MQENNNLAMLATVARALRDLKDEVVFVGGATVDLYVDDPKAPSLRVTDDVDCVVEIAGRMEYRKLEEKLVALKFQHPIDDPGAPICRWKLGDLKVDVMSTSAEILGFSNRWYSEGMVESAEFTLPDGQTVRAMTLPYFVATKIEAFAGRGGGDYMLSPDMEDIIAVADGVKGFAAQIVQAPDSVRGYLKEKLGAFLSNKDFMDRIPGHLGSSGGEGRINDVLATLRSVASS